MSQRVVDGLNELLADSTVLYQKLRHYHWNVSGPHFFELHVKFEEMYDRWNVWIDDIAERILTVEGVPLHTLGMLLEASSLEEDPTIPDAAEMVRRIESDVRVLLERSGSVIEAAERAGDRGTINLMDGMRDAMEKDLWMLRAWGLEPARSWS